MKSSGRWRHEEIEINLLSEIQVLKKDYSAIEVKWSDELNEKQK